MYNFAFAFVICAVVYIIGEVFSALTKAWIPAVFITAVLFLLGYWTIIPHDVVSDAYLSFGGTLGIYFCIVHVGTLLSIKQLLAQWKTIVVCLTGLAGMCVFCYFVCPLFMDKVLMIVGLPPLTGGIVATTMMKEAALAKGMELAAVFAITMYCIQGFAGYPLTSIFLQIEGKRLLKGYRSGEMQAMNKGVAEEQWTKASKKLIPPVPEKFNSPVVILGKVAFVAWLSMILGSMTGINGAVIALILSVVFSAIGFLDADALSKANSYGILSFALTMYIFDGLKDCTPEMLTTIVVPLIVLVVIGVAGLALTTFIFAKILKLSVPLSFATCLTALFGFPFNVIITESTCNALTEKNDEREFLKDNMLPSMIVGGFTTVTIASVFIAGVFVGLL